jgi:hypothetical protein
MKLIRSILCFLVVVVLVIIGTFPENSWVYSTGIDYSIRWVFNYLFQTNSELGANIVFPHGPLGILIYPLPGNIQFAYLVQSIVKALFIAGIFQLINEENEDKKWAITFFVSFIFCLFLGFTHLCLLVIILSLYLGIKKKSLPNTLLGIFVVAVSLYVSAYQGVIALIIFVSSLFYELFSKQWKQMLFKLVGIIISIIIINLFLYGRIIDALDYFIGLANLIQDNSSAVAYYPQNDWVLLSLFFLCLIFLTVINIKSKTGLLFISLSALSLFAAWKHGMAREDTTHARGFIEFGISVLILFLISQEKRKFINTITVTIAFFLITANLVNVTYYGQTSYHPLKAGIFAKFVKSGNELEKQAIAESNNNIKVNKLPIGFIDLIDKKTVDIYPWDYTIIKANNLNWQPRVVIQSYASYTSWLDQKNANHFESKKAPEFIVWMVENNSTGLNNGEYNSIDSRYILNDEPKTIIKILQNYKLIKAEENFYLYQKRDRKVELKTNKQPIIKSQLGEWNSTEFATGSLFRLKVRFKKSLMQKVKSFLFKDEQYWLSMKLQDNTIHQYRIVPKNAEDGIWINPYLIKRGELSFVDEVKITASNPSILDIEYNYNWEEYKFEEPKLIESFFEADIDTSIVRIVNSDCNFENRDLVYRPSLQYDSIYFDTGTNSYSHVVKPNSFSSGFNFQSNDSIEGMLNVHANTSIYWDESIEKSNVMLVIEVKEGQRRLKYERVFVDQQIINTNGLNTVVINTTVPFSGKNLQVISYLWNTSKHYLKVDKFNVQVWKN